MEILIRIGIKTMPSQNNVRNYRYMLWYEKTEKIFKRGKS